MARQKMQFSKRSILARVRKGPVKLRELARGSENHEVRLVGDAERAMLVLQNGNVAGKTLITTLPDQAVRLLERPTGGAQ